MSLSWDVGAFVCAVAVALLWLVRLIITQELGGFETRLIAKLDAKYYGLEVAQLQQRDLERRLDAIEHRMSVR